MSVPEAIRLELKERLWKAADELGWLNLSASAKSRHYEAWSRDPSVGGLLARYIPISDVRLYLKDTLLKGYSQDRLSDDSMPGKLLGISLTDQIVQQYVKPHGRRLEDGRIVCWGRAASWKAILMAAYERTHATTDFRAFGVILTHAAGRYKQNKTRSMVEEAAHKLGIERIVWVD